MKKIISGAIGVNVQLKANSRTFFPNIPALRDKKIKYISVLNDADNVFITLREKHTQSEVIKNIPANELKLGDDPIFINKTLDLPYSYIDTKHATKINEGDNIHITFWFDAPEVSNYVPLKKNKTVVYPLELKLTGKRTYFDENEILRGKKIQNLLASFPSVSPKGNNIIDYTYRSQVFITLCYGNFEFISNVPLEYFYQGAYDTQLLLQNIRVDFRKSFVEVEQVNSDLLKSVFFNVVIDDNKKNICSCKCNH